MTRISTLLAFVLSLFMLSACTAQTSNAAEYKAGEDYIELASPEKIYSDKIIVREFFWYGCPHCYHLEPHALNWKKTKPADVAFYQTPAAMNPVWEASARGLYAVQSMGKLAATHEPLFDAVQNKNQKLFDQNSLADFYAGYGVDKTKFNAAYNSFAVATKINRSKAAAKRYQLSGVPAVVVHGKYVVKGSDAEVFKIVDYLVKKVRAEGIVSSN